MTLKRNLRIAAGDVCSQEQCSIVLDTGYFSMGWRDHKVRWDMIDSSVCKEGERPRIVLFEQQTQSGKEDTP